MSQPSLIDIAAKLGSQSNGFAGSVSGALKAASTAHGQMTDAAGKVKDATQQWTSGGSLIRFTQSSRVEPLVIVESELGNLDITSDIMKMLHTRFSAYYLLGVSMLTTVGNARVVETLNQLNPDRRAYGVGLESFKPGADGTLKAAYDRSLESNFWRNSVADYDWRLPSRENKEALAHRLGSYSIESQPPSDTGSDDARMAKAQIRENQAGFDKQEQHKADMAKAAKRDADAASQAAADASVPEPEAPRKSVKAELDFKSFDAVQTAANLSIGRLVKVTLESEGVSAVVPVSIRLMVSLLRGSLISEFFVGDSKMDKTLKERYFQWKAGSIGFWRDLVFCQDLVKKRRRKLVNDKQGVAYEIHKRELNSQASTAITAKASLASRSNLFVVSKASVADVYRRSGVNIENFSSRQALFDAGMVMMMVVVDTERDLVQIYEDSIRTPTTLTMRDIQQSSGKADNGAAIMELLKGMQSARPGF